MKISTKSLAFTALLTAVICVLSPIIIPIGAIPISLGTLAIYLACAVLDWKHGTAAVVVFIALGMVGVPVFTGYTGGFAKVAGPTGGYIVGYIPMALIMGIMIDKLEKHIWAYPVAMVAGTAVLYVFGTAWFMISTSATLGTALIACVVPFLGGDAAKIVIATLVSYKLRFLIRKVVTGEKKKKKEQSPPAETTSDLTDIQDSVPQNSIQTAEIPTKNPDETKQ